MEQTFATLADGNYGAFSFLMQLSTSPEVTVSTVAKVQNSGIVGTDLWVLFSDLCGKDLGKVVKLVDECPLDILKDACSRQDYSGRELVKEFLK